MTFQFTHKNYITSPKTFQAREHALLPVPESEDKTLFLHKFITVATESCDLLTILPFLQKGLEPPAGAGTPCPRRGEELAWPDGSKGRAAAQASTHNHSHQTLQT